MDSQELRRTFSLANAFKEGDLAVGGTTDDGVREAARRVLLSITIADIRRAVLVDDRVTAALMRTRDRRFDDDLDALTVAQAKAVLLGPARPPGRAGTEARWRAKRLPRSPRS